MTTIGFWTHAEQQPDRPAIIDHDGTSLTYGELNRRANRLAHGLQSQGLKAGDAVAVTLGNEPAFLEVALAAAQIGLYLTPINVRLTGPEMAHILDDCRAKVWIVGERVDAAARQAAADLVTSAPLLLAAGKAPGITPLDDLTDGQPDTPPAERTAGQVMLYTSGTTGQPKGVRRPLPGVEPEAAARLTAGLAMLFGLTPGSGVHLVAAPLYTPPPWPSPRPPFTSGTPWCCSNGGTSWGPSSSSNGGRSRRR